jgi:hypothetical protein
MISGRINLAQLKHAIITKKGQSGMIEGIFIPIELNGLFKSDKGNVFLDLIAFDSVNKEYKQTHAIKQSLPKEKYEAMSEEEKKLTPFIGHLNANVGGEKAPNQMDEQFDDVSQEGDDDLPF